MFTLNPSRIFLVAECGINHNGDMDIARQLIHAAAAAGFDCVKFQKRTIDVVYTQAELDAPREHPFGTTNRELKEHLEFNERQYEEIAALCYANQLLWTTSPWDEESVDFLVRFNPPYIKIASASLTDRELIQKCARTRIPLFISTGMTSQDEILIAVDRIKQVGGHVGCIYHCTSTYPTSLNEINLLGIQTLQHLFPDIPIGYSGHEKGIAPSILAVALGAMSVERHITLDRTMFGSDQAASLEPKGQKQLVRDIRDWETAKGDGKLVVYDSELPISKKLRRKHTLFDA